MNGPLLTIRVGVESDSYAVFDLISELALYERASDQVTNTAESLKEAGFGTTPLFGLFVAENELGIIVGMALYYRKYSTWKGPCLFLEDIIVTKAWRGRGVGAQLFEAVAKEAAHSGAGKLEWQVLEWNEPAINFYKKYNADLDSEWVNGKLTDYQLKSFLSR